MTTKIIAKIIALPVAAILSGCVAMGGIADHVDPVEAQLVKRLTSELCKVNFSYKGQRIKTETVRAAFVGVADISDIGGDGGREASITLKGGENSMTYNPHTAMVYCGEPSIRTGGFIYYDQVSQILVDRGGDPDIYFRRLKKHEAYQADVDAGRKKERARRDTRPLDATFPIRVEWEGMAEALNGSIREVRKGSKGTMAIELPKSLGTCTGEYQYTGHNVGTWDIGCPDDLTAAGTFKSGQGAHGEGTDNAGRRITYTIDVGS